MIVDTHVHVLGEDRVRYPRKPNPQYRWTSEDFTVEDLLRDMDACGIDQAVLVQAFNAYRCDNSYVCDKAAQYPERLAAVGVLDATQDDALAQLGRWVGGRGMAGVRLMLPGPVNVDDPRVLALMARAASLHVPVCLFTGFDQLVRVPAILERTPGLVLTLDHMGRPDTDEGPPYKSLGPLFALARFPQCHLKFSSTTVFASMKGRSTPKAFFTRVIDAFGASRLLWGSNYPMNAEAGVPGLYAKAREALSFLGATEHAELFGRAASRLWPIPREA